MWIRTCRLIVALPLALVVGCKHYPVNEPLAERTTDAGYYLHNQPREDNSGDLLLVLAFSNVGHLLNYLTHIVLGRNLSVEDFGTTQ